IAGAVAALEDPYTSYTPAADTEILFENRRGEFGGIGAVFNKAVGSPVSVSTIYAGFPAQAAGLRAGDEVTAVDSVEIIDLSIDEAVSLIRGAAGSLVTLTVVREGVPEPLQIG